MSDRKQSTDEPAHDILAAEEFGVGVPDPKLHSEPPHDVLAAEEFGVGTEDPGLHHRGPVDLPADPSGIAEPHDVLAAEEFALPAGRTGSVFGADAFNSAAGSWRGRLLGAAGVLGALVLMRRRGRGR
jgi:hypothetical protein